MQRAAVFVFVFVCSALTLAGQSRPQSPNQAPNIPSPNIWTPRQLTPQQWASACPVRMQAQHGTGRGLLLARDRQGESSARTDQASQRIHLVLGNADGKQIAQARVMVRGYGAKVRVEHALSSPGAPRLLSRTLVVHMQPEDKETAEGDLMLPGFTSVQSIELLALRFDDGSSWNALLGTPCSVTPDPLMLIADR